MTLDTRRARLNHAMQQLGTTVYKPSFHLSVWPKFKVVAWRGDRPTGGTACPRIEGPGGPSILGKKVRGDRLSRGTVNPATPANFLFAFHGPYFSKVGSPGHYHCWQDNMYYYDSELCD